jgi:hypothetical protein
MKRTLLAVVAFGSLVSVPCSVMAAGISGQIGFFGGAQVVDKSLDPATLDSATGIAFDNPVAVTMASGNFASYLTAFSSTAQFTDFTFNPSSEVNPLWTAGGFSFVLTSIQIMAQNANELTLKGTGYVSGNGFEATTGSWNFSGFSSIGTSAVGQSFMFNAETITDLPTRGVPDEGNTLMLFGIAMAFGLGLMAVKQVSRPVTVRR